MCKQRYNFEKIIFAFCWSNVTASSRFQGRYIHKKMWCRAFVCIVPIILSGGITLSIAYTGVPILWNLLNMPHICPKIRRWFLMWPNEVPYPYFWTYLWIFISSIHDCHSKYDSIPFCSNHHWSLHVRFQWNVEYFSNQFQLLIHVPLLKLPSEECQRILLMMISQYWFR